MNPASRPAGHGLGLRRALLREVEADPPACAAIDFWELAPENWIDVGGALGRRLRAFSAEHALVAHGLALNLGGLAPLDAAFIARLRRFLDEHGIACYSEHLSFCADHGQLYDLLPIPFTRAAVAHVASRIREVQERLERRIAIENVSYYCAPGQAMPEIEFVCAVLEAADCDLLLDVNNIYVNSVNHGYDAHAFLRALPGERIAYAHIAGHQREADDLVIDTHGADVIEPVWDLLDAAYRHFGVFPTLLERDFNLPPLRALVGEAGRIAALQQRHACIGPLRTAIHA